MGEIKKIMKEMIEERKMRWNKAKQKIDLDEVETALIEKYGEIGKEELSESEILKMIEQQKLATSFPISAEDYAIWISGRLTDEEVRHWGSLITACLCCCVEDEEMNELYEEAEEFRNYLESQPESFDGLVQNASARSSGEEGVVQKQTYDLIATVITNENSSVEYREQSLFSAFENDNIENIDNKLPYKEQNLFTIFDDGNLYKLTKKRKF